MYCKHCGKEIADDSKFCSNCGAGQEVGSASILSIEEKKLNEQYVKPPLSAYLGKRLIGSFIDKMAILFFSLIVIVLICFLDSEFSRELGIFGAMFRMSKDSVYSAAVGHVMSFFPTDIISQHQLEIENRFQYLIWVELKIAYLFIVINILYYAICEKIISSSLGKSLFNLKLVSTHYTSAKNIPLSIVVYRASWFLFITSGIILLRWLIGYNYFVVVALFFLIMDLPILFKRASLLDILTKTILISYKKDKSPKEEKTSVDNVENQVVRQPAKVDDNSCYIFNIIIFLFLIILISLHINYSYLYANFEYGYRGMYNPTERFVVQGYNLSSYEEPWDIKELVGSDKLFGRHVSTLGFKDDVKDLYKGILYEYQCTISTYDISSSMSIIGNNDIISEQCLFLLAQKTKAKERIIKGDIKAITWYGNRGMTNKFMGICANDRLYIIKAESRKNLEYRSEWLFDLFDFTYYPQIKYYQNFILIITILIGICCVLFFVLNTNGFKSLPINNRYAFSLFIMSLLSIVINIIIASVTSNMLDSILFEDWPLFIMIGSESTALISSLCLSVYYFRKSKMKWDEYYLVPSFLKRNLCNSFKSNKSKNKFIKWVCYPLMILSLLPCGFYIALIYSLPLLLFIIYKRWHNWASASKLSNHEES